MAATRDNGHVDDKLLNDDDDDDDDEGLNKLILNQQVNSKFKFYFLSLT